jgi:hypothetical protein
MSEDKITAAKAEVQRLLDVGFIKPINYSTRLANVFMVPKKNGKWRMCIDFTDLNKACPKEDFPLTRTEVAIDSVAGCEIMSLLDCFSRFHQIWLRIDDQEKTSFITSFGPSASSECPKDLKTLVPCYAGWSLKPSRNKSAEIFSPI